ncbi:O-antigen ligase family protein [Streptomyces sp. NPDC059828]|uniref:O-antigen ligase family protein n=1 Tax=Streptomyces sp. NPDC059828 TaxID=3346965 RepID=UPI00365AD056
MIPLDGISTLLLLVALTACGGFLLLVAARHRRAVWYLWAASLVPLFLFGRSYATVGLDPIYLLDTFTWLALLATTPAWLPRAFSEPRLNGFRAVAILLCIAAIQAVVRGIFHDHPGAVKGIILGIYPVLAWFAATWFLTRPAEEILRWRWVLYVPSLGVFLVAGLGEILTPAASGLYLAIAGAFGMILHRTGSSRLLLWTLAGAAALTAVASKRGPLLAVLAAIAATALASRCSSRRTRQWPALTLSFAIVGVLAVLGTSAAGQGPSALPVVGGLADRLVSSASDPDGEAANNVELRFLMWRKALDVADQNPLLGGGAGRPIDVVFDGALLNKAESGPHNSFIGYLYYLGWPAGIAFASLVIATLWRTWRAREHLVSAAWFGATVGLCLTSFTNVAFETTYIGLPSWLLLACAFALVGVPRAEAAASANGALLPEGRGGLAFAGAATRPPPHGRRPVSVSGK